MDTQDLIIIDLFCEECQIETHFIEELEDFGLIHTVVYNNTKYLHREELVHVEKVIRMHNDLNINKEGIAVILDLLHKMNQLTSEVKLLKTRLGLYE